MKVKKSRYHIWKNTLVKDSSNLETVIKNLEKTALQIVLVVDKENKLLGTITDGDIRRGLLKGLTKKDKINTIVNRKAITVNSQITSSQVERIMVKKGIRHIPIVNNKNQVTDLHIWDKPHLSEKIDNNIVFMVGGKGKRLMPLTKSMPKPMLKVKGKPILEILVKKAKSEGFNNLIFITNHLENVIKSYFNSGSNWGVNIKYYNEKEPLGTAGGLSFIRSNRNKPVIVLNGDVITEISFKNLLDFHKNQNNEATIAVKKFEIENPYGVIRMSKEKVVDLIEKPISKSYVSAGIYVFNPVLFKKIKKNKYLDMSLFINRLLKRKIKITACPIHERWIDIGQHTDYKKANH